MIYSQSFFFSALREDSSKSNSRGGFKRLCSGRRLPCCFGFTC